MDEILSFGAWLKQRRNELGYTQQELASLSGCSPATIRKIEAGERKPSRQVAELLVAQLEVPATEHEALLKWARMGPGALAHVEHAPTGGPASAQAPSMQSTPKQAANLPVLLTPLIGREAELAELHERLLRPDARLLTLTGPAGIGKTRVAIEVARGLGDEFPDGVCFVALAPISDPALVAPTIAQSLGLMGGGSRSARGLLLDYLCDKEVLLVLDNFEQVVSEGVLVVDLLAGCPGVKALITSRETLRVRSERFFSVPPLELPDLDHLPLLEELANYPALALFVDRAQGVNPNFELTEENAAAVAAICRRLDGLPLAIELASARIKLFPPALMLERLAGDGGGAPLQMLTGGPRDLPERHQTLRNAIAWSYDLLDEGEKLLFTRLGVFVGGCTLTTAEAVCNAEDDLPMSALDGMESLLAKSLLRYEETGYNEPRFTMLETIREYALERLMQSGEMETTRVYHAEYYLALAKAAEPEFAGKQQGLWMTKLDEEHDNLRAVLKWSLASDNGETALRIGAVLWRYWEARCHFSEGRYWLESALKKAETISTPGRAKSLYGASRLAWLQGDATNAFSFAEQSVAMWRELRNKDGLAISLHNLAIITGESGDHATAMAYYEESLALWEELGDRAGVARVYNSMGELASEQGDYDRASALYSQSLEIHRSLGRQVSVALVTANMGFMAHQMGDYDKAEALFTESLRSQYELGIKIGVAACLVGLGAVAQRKSQPERAAILAGATEALCEATSYALEPRERAVYAASMEAARAALGDTAFQDYLLDGKAMGMGRAVDYALET